MPGHAAPTAPTGLAATATTQTSIAVSWTAATDNVAVTAYGTYRNAAPAGNPTGTSYTFTGLTCGTSYTLSVDAADAAGNRSAQTSITAATATCPAPRHAGADRRPATSARPAQSTTSVSLAWNAATDNTGVTGYGVYRNGTLVSSPTTLTATVSGLTCNTTYTFAVDAADAAGTAPRRRRSPPSTSACPPPGTADLYIATNGSSLEQLHAGCSLLDLQPAPTRWLDPGNTVQVAGGQLLGAEHQRRAEARRRRARRVPARNRRRR